jgi:uncharacterized protein
MPILRIACLVAFAFALGSPNAQAQSFNCNYAKLPDEVVICQNERLGSFDEIMSQLFFRLRNGLTGRERQRLEFDQADWLQQRHDCGSDGDCIAQAYRRRIAELRELTNAL